jgi:UDP-N-acetylmuramoyl-tripeptide--D-alanyl-D-alanine ligase
MIAVTTAELAALAGGRADLDEPIRGVTVDSRRVAPGDLFVALPGARAHGAAFADAALAAGAVAALVPQDAAGPRRVVVADPLQALGLLAAEVRRRSRARVVAVTGSTGKTSTKDILAALVRPHGSVVASRANENNQLGMPLTLCRLEPGTDVAVLEMGMRGLGHIAYLAGLAHPDVAVITGVGPVHLELLGSVEAVAQAKAELLADLPESATAIVPQGDPLLAPYVSRTRARVLGFGEAADADLRLLAFSHAERVAELELLGRRVSVRVPFAQHHNALNLAAAAGAYLALGLPLDGLAAGAADIALSAWRGEELPLPGGGFLVADCYNANPTSMRAALAHLQAAAGGRRTVAVLGEMAELGTHAERYHREVGEAARDLGIDVVVGVGPLARGYGGRSLGGLAEAREALPALLRPGDAVLLKGSRAAGLEALLDDLAGTAAR